MNSSTNSEYDNVSALNSLSDSRLYKKLNDLVNVNTELEVRIFCPLCVMSFTLKFSLFEHLKTFHYNFLTQAGNQCLQFKECPFCSAKFCGKHLIAKHALHHHTKVVESLFVHKNKLTCFFCNEKFDIKLIKNHIEEFHFLDFEEEFRKLFSCETTEMSVTELLNSTSEKEDKVKNDWKNFNRCVESKSENNSYVKDFDEASKINCYDFTELKQQLENIKKSQLRNSGDKSTLKEVGKVINSKKSARRVLKFDLPSASENKENCEVSQTSECKTFSIKNKLNDSVFETPQHSSTPKSTEIKTILKNISNYKTTFKSYITKENITEFEFQCGKCRSLFKKNSQLVHHIKANHKKFSLSVLQPCYTCAICNARFYRNGYLKKHHNIHKPY